jgi:uncharacterized damage-inducible protein DinB
MQIFIQLLFYFRFVCYADAGGTMSKILDVIKISGYPPEIGAALWRLEDTRRRTLDLLKEMPEEYIDYDVQGNTIGTILYHIALIEMDWLFVEILNEPIPDEVIQLFPEEVRDQEGHLTPIKSLTFEQHLNRLRAIRQILMDKLVGMTVEEFHRKRILPQYEVSPEWVLHHLSQHEAEHRGEIGAVINFIKQELSK